MQPFNKYYPPDWTPEKGSINKYKGTHALGVRAKKIDQGILVVRFELPYNIWCLGCNNHIGQGVRYNAEKKKVGNYYSTPIMNFRMKCHLCDNYIEIQTDPKNSAYVVVSGARKKVEEWKQEDTEVIQLQDKETKEKLETDPMYRLEHGIKDKQIISKSAPHLTQLQHLNQSQWSDPYTKSQQLRRQFRTEKKLEKAQLEENKVITDKHSLQIELLPEIPSDVIGAKSVEFSTPHLLDKKRLGTAVKPLFSSDKKEVASEKELKDLKHIAKIHTRLKTDPFYQPNPFSNNSDPKKKASSGSTTKLDDVKVVKPFKKKKKVIHNIDAETSHSLVAYTDSESDSE